MKYTIRIKNSMFGYERDEIMTVEADSEAEAIEAGRKIDRFATITINQPKEPTMNGDQIDALVLSELQSAAHSLADTILEYGLDYDDSVQTLAGVLSTIQYYSTSKQYTEFLYTLPESVLDMYEDSETTVEQLEDGTSFVTTSLNSDLAHNLTALGFQAYLAMAELGFIAIEDMIKLAKAQLQSNGTNSR